MTQREKGERFRALHEGEPFVIPNPWDAGSARIFEGLGFEALATTSSGFAFTLGKRDGEVTLDEIAAHTAALDAATDLPVSVDLENGYGPSPEDAARAITRAAAAGAVGGSIEDWDRAGRIYEHADAVERVFAAVEAARSLDFPFMLTARAEGMLHDDPNVEDVIERLQAFEAAGADVLYAPGLASVEQIDTVCSALTKPVNVLARPTLSFDEIVGAGAQRVSVGGALTWTAVEALVEAARAIAERGDFSRLGSGSVVDNWQQG